MFRRSFLASGLRATCAVGAMLPLALPAAGPPVQATVGKPAPGFDVPDTADRRHTLAEFKGKTVVLEWTSSTCPFAAAQYKSGRMPALQRWAKAKGVVWLTILSSHPSRSEYLNGAQAEAFNRKRSGAPSALLIDSSGDMGHRYGAATADHMFVIASDGTLVYGGGIDDSNSQDPKEVATSYNYVRAALTDVLAGRRVKTSVTEPFGCALAYAG
jgi:hypothetical protein